MQTRVLFLLFILFFSQHVEAQEENAGTNATYFNYLQSGMLLGKSGTGSSVTISTVHGLRMKRFSFGIGIGYDDYSRNTIDYYLYQPAIYDNWRSMPVFAAVSYDWLSLKNGALFLQVNAGYAKMWERRTGEIDRASDVKGGFLFNPMTGVRINAANMRLYILAGYKIQRNSYKFDDGGIWSYPGRLISIEESLGRAVIKIGFGIN